MNFLPKFNFQKGPILRKKMTPQNLFLPQMKEKIKWLRLKVAPQAKSLQNELKKQHNLSENGQNVLMLHP